MMHVSVGSGWCVAATLAMLWPVAGQTTVWDATGVIETCNPLACSLGDIMAGDTVAGFLLADDAVGGPNSVFTDADVLDFLIVVRDAVTGDELLRVGPAEGAILVSGSFATDGDGELVADTAEFFGEFDSGGIFGIVPLDITIDIAAGTFSVSTTLLQLGEIATGPIGFAREPDGDNVPSVNDNCISWANPGQADTDLDSIGNACDPDHDQSCTVNFVDLSLFKTQFLGTNPAYDYTGDGNVNFADLTRLKQFFLGTPGPSGLPNLCGP